MALRLKNISVPLEAPHVDSLSKNHASVKDLVRHPTGHINESPGTLAHNLEEYIMALEELRCHHNVFVVIRIAATFLPRRNVLPIFSHLANYPAYYTIKADQGLQVNKKPELLGTKLTPMGQITRIQRTVFCVDLRKRMRARYIISGHVDSEALVEGGVPPRSYV